jgi:hypothetical protein
MSKIKATVDFSGYTNSSICPTAQTIHDKMVAAAGTFTTPPILMPAFQTLITTCQTKLAAKASRSTSDVIAFNIARHDLETALADLGAYVNLVAKGDQTTIDASGFPSYDTARTIDTTPPAAPTDVNVRQGDLSGSYIARYHPDRTRSINEVQQCTGDPNVEANWVHMGMFSGGKATVSGIIPGTTVWVRIRTVGLKGVMGAWSDPAKIIVV